ncbi:MAG: citrate synthase [Armatimonadota bacterium]|nr:citrate synthase [Armatimonadota bacterium]MDR7463784.1 citrate synthase [Armatimonadota bacterium]MDR7469470.1 citrate synthase [Armatimonadota bacterium]MDR7473824.1 citrate synthase [Armatimonadota bacterium]MDR7539117.1 citrate synthase [Armatimonadota bacterium]
MQSQVQPGLEGVVAAASAICFVDGHEGRLLYQGYDIHDLAEQCTFEEVVYLLWHGELPARPQLEALRRELGAARALPAAVQGLLSGLPRTADPMDVLRTVVSALALYDADLEDRSREGNLRKAARLVAQFPTIVAAYHRLRQGQAPVAPQPEAGHAADFLRMLFGREPDPEHARAMDVALILHADHELNASTFAARVTAATLSDIYAAVTSAIGTLKGPLHGGANAAVMELLQEAGTLERVEPVVLEKLARKERIPGFGHRVYRTEDPRVRHLRRLSQRLGERAGDLRWFQMTRRMEEVVMRERQLYPNVDLYSASVYAALGITPDLFPPIFAVSRISGWTGHILEQYADNRLIRPRADYIGPRQREFVPLDRR